MNIKELIDWRQDCFFCHEELTIFPVVNGISAQCFIKDNHFIIKSRFTNLSIHIETGKTVTLNEDEVMVDDIVNSTQLKIACKCLACKENGCLYEYSGSMSLSPLLNKQSFTFREKVAITNKWLFCQIQNCGGEWGIIKTFKRNDDILTPQSKFELMKSHIKTPFFDLKKLTPVKLEHKLKTYIVFS
jgi:hypothetical protein